MNEFDNAYLQRQFKRKCHLNTRKLKGDDADHLIPRTSEVFKKLVDGLYIYGGFPWEETNESRVLYHSTYSSVMAESFLPFVFPNNRSTIFKKSKNFLILLFYPLEKITQCFLLI